jgi:choice-of-anchor A domain-containing protein
MLSTSRMFAAVAVVATGLVAPFAAASSAGAQAPSSCSSFPLGPAGAFAEFIHHDASRVSDSEGRVAIGGNATLGDRSAGIGFSIGSGQPVDSVGLPLPPDPNRHDLIVGGTLDAFNVVLLNGGARYGALAPGSTPMNSRVPGASITAGPPTEYADGSGPLDFDAIFDDLSASSTFWAALPANGTTTETRYPTGMDLVGTASGLNVFSITAAQLNAATYIRIKVPEGATTLVNVSGPTINMNQGPLGYVSIWDPVTGEYIVDDHFINGLPVPSTTWLTIRQSLLWNFDTATSILKNYVSWPGTILAPLAHVQLGQGNIGPGHINGSLIADSVDSVPGAETHDMGFVGCLPVPPGPTGSIHITKQITGPPPTAAAIFEFSVDCGTDGGVHAVSISVAAGAISGSATVDDLPVGAVCSITETAAPPGFDPVSISPNPVTVPAVGDPAVIVTAVINHQLGDLVLIKDLDRPAPVDGTVTLHVSCDDGTNRDVQLTVLAGSDSARTEIGGIAVGAVCTVTETAAPSDWQAVSISPTSVTIASEGTPPVTVTALDNVRLGDLRLIKQTTTAPTTATTFMLHVDCGSALVTHVAITVPAGMTIGSAPPITGLPFGTTCVVSEPSLPSGWILQSISPSSVVIGAGGATTVTVTATNAPTGVTANLSLIKQLTGGSDDTTHQFVLHVACTDGTSTDVTVTIPAGDTSGEATLEGLTPGAQCMVTEPAPNAGFNLTSVTPNRVTVGLASQAPVVVTATNDYQTGSLQVVKQLTAPAPSAAAFEFTLDCDGTAFDRPLTLDVPGGATSATTTISGLPVGIHCTLTEVNSPAGYLPTSITPSGGVTVGAAPATATLTAVNTAIPGALKIVKDLSGGTADLVVPIQVHLACTDPTFSRDAGITLPPGDTTAQILVTELPVGAHCAVTEAAPPAPLTFVGVSPASVTIGVGPPVTVTVTNHLDGYTGALTKRLTTTASTPVTFTFTMACDDPQFDRHLTLTMTAASAQASLTVAGIPGNVACTLSEPETPGWTPVSRTPTDGTITAAAPTVIFLNQPDPILPLTGITGPDLPLAIGAALVLSGGLLTALSTRLGKRQRRNSNPASS